MKKTVLFAAAIFFMANIFAQKIRIGITAGPVLSNTNKATSTINTGGPNDRTISHNMAASFKFGAVASIPLSNFIVFRPELTYLEKGWKNNFDYVTGTDYVSRLASHWIEIPLDFVYNVPAKNGRFFIGLGPYLSYALSATVKNSNDSADVKVIFTDPPSNAPQGSAYANRFDVGVDFLTGYEFGNGFFASLNYSHGFLNFRNDQKASPSNKNIIIGLSIGYMFK